MLTPNHDQLAVLIGAPQPGNLSMHHDLGLMYNVLRHRGLDPSQIVSMEGQLDRTILMNFLRSIGKRVRERMIRTLFLYVTGNGFYVGTKPESAAPGLDLGNGEHVLWEEIWPILDLNPQTKVLVLPDH
ncbi:hypothetical protein GC175_00655 [bacterium]|nr:hypothetical protein [bacterium]